MSQPLPLVVGLAVAWLLAAGSSSMGQAITLGAPPDRPDRFVTIAGDRAEDLLAEYSVDGEGWRPATIYVGATIDEWRPCAPQTWDAGAIEGRIPAGDQACVWNYWFDVEMPVDAVDLRLTRPDDSVALLQTVDLTGAGDVFVIDRRNCRRLVGGEMPQPWGLEPAGHKTPGVDSIHCPADDPTSPPLVLSPGVTGWHRIYVGMEPYSAFRLWLSGEHIEHAVPDYLASPDPNGRDRHLQELYIKSADLTGQDVCLAIGGARQARRPVSVRHIRLVPMTDEEVAHHRDVRRLAAAEGRPFAGYVEQVTPAHYEPSTLTLHAHTRNQMRLHRFRGCTDVYVHVIRLGSKAWYHSDVVEREALGSEQQFREAAEQTRMVFGGAVKAANDASGWERPAKWAAWMEQGDPLQVAIDEARAVGLGVFADMGMNVTYIVNSPQMTERTIREHPEYLSDHPMFLDYTQQPVRDYAVTVAGELLDEYDLDGIHLDFARFGYRNAFDEASLIDVVRRIHERRQAAEARWGHPMEIAVRIPSYYYGSERSSEATYGGEYAQFVSALEVWAESGWIDRVMPCSMSQEDRPKLSMERYAAAVAGTDVRLWGDLYRQGFDTPRSHHLAIARKWVGEGLDGGFFFYAHHRPTEYERINWMLRLIDFPDVVVEP